MPKGHKGVSMVEKTCPVCGTLFSVPKRGSHQKTCSPQCGQKLRVAAVEGKQRKPRVSITCQHCGCEFDTFASRAKAGAKFCSKECSDAGRSARVSKTCEHCGVVFMVARFRADEARFCGNKCAKEVLPKLRRNRVTMNCSCCGKEFETHACKAGRKKFCSKECMWKVMRGEGSPHWAGIGHYEYVVSDDGSETKRRSHHVNAARTAERNASKKRATPAWADMKKMRRIYAVAERMTDLTGIKHVVDHAVPLKSKIVCGLHCEHNLRVIVEEDNLKKHNKHDPHAW